jgi:hypothetical protein
MSRPRLAFFASFWSILLLIFISIRSGTVSRVWFGMECESEGTVYLYTSLYLVLLWESVGVDFGCFWVDFSGLQTFLWVEKCWIETAYRGFRRTFC